jgi:carbonic anhydrase/acetyltransferase-like protein (isoleucine patch superfamily)
MIHKNVVTDFSSKEYSPTVDETAYVHPLAAVIGNAFIGKRVMVSPFASVRGDEGQPLIVDDEANVQDGVIIHALETEHEGHAIEKNMVDSEKGKCAVYVGKRVSLAHQVQIHGPSYVGDDTFVGMQSLVFKSRIGKGCVIEPGCTVMGVKVKDGRYVPAGTVLKDQKTADALPEITPDYAFKDLNKGVVHVNTHLADRYRVMKP